MADQIIIRNYSGSESAATGKYQTDAAKLAEQGYYPISQSWAAGSYGCGAFLFAFILCFVLIGFIVFIYMLIVKPDDVMTVTYKRQGNAHEATSRASDDKTCPRCAEHVKMAAVVCRFCGHEFRPQPARVPRTAGPTSHEVILGVHVVALSAEHDLPIGMRGAYVEHVNPNSPAQLAGLQAGDVIVALFGWPIRDKEDLVARAQEFVPGKTVSLEFIRQGQRHKIRAAL